ncbi:tyrosine-type recombinase/integrase [Halomarina pelagica]|uniref:tyrosine-type recombinase/integrase n=1 Tax=Halomarina pelagica TaxID=2961599 RepID=UPI0020C569CD|nr:tyrosine-type recombinase/integrase [Halomarina sp. BND7]
MTYRWTTRDLDDLERFYWTEVAPAMEADDRDPERDRPPYAWMVEHGFSGFIKALRRDHGLTPGEFYDRLDVGREGDEDYWGIDHDPTRRTLDGYVDELRDRRGHPRTTVLPIRSRLKKYVRLYADVHGTSNLLGALLEERDRPDEIDRALAVFDVLHEVLGTTASKFKYLEDVRRFYDYLVDAGRAVYNPLERMENRFGWDRPEWDNPALSADDVRALYGACETLEERLLVVGLAGWGLRPSELCALRVDQLVLDPSEGRPYIAFGDGERKNGPGTVALLVGVGELRRRVASLDEGARGYLFPSATAAGGHVVTDTVRGRFAALAERADVTVAGETPTPKMGRRFWYSLYGDAVRRLVDRYAPIAADQGSSDPGVVLDNYLSEAERRKHRRDAMQDALTGVLGDGRSAV